MNIPKRLYEHEFETKQGETVRRFKIYSNLPNLIIPFESWVARAKEGTAESFVEYVRSKGTGHFVCTEAEMTKAVEKKRAAKISELEKDRHNETFDPLGYYLKERKRQPLPAKELKKWLDK